MGEKRKRCSAALEPWGRVGTAGATLCRFGEVKGSMSEQETWVPQGKWEGPQNTLSLFCYLPKASFANGRQDMFAGKKCLTMLNANMSTAKTSWRCHILHKPKSCIWKDYLMCLFIKTSEKVLFYFTFIGLSLRGHFNICKETDFA